MVRTNSAAALPPLSLARYAAKCAAAHDFRHGFERCALSAAPFQRVLSFSISILRSLVLCLSLMPLLLWIVSFLCFFPRGFCALSASRGTNAGAAACSQFVSFAGAARESGGSAATLRSALCCACRAGYFLVGPGSDVVHGEFTDARSPDVPQLSLLLRLHITAEAVSGRRGGILEYLA